MSKDQLLLRKVGSFFYGGEWQAPLARDLGVGERTMRRWVAGTEKIPRGVWRDLGEHLDGYQRGLAILVSAVKQNSGLVEVHAFKVWDTTAGDQVQPSRKSTAERIARIQGEIIPGTSEWVEPSAIDSEGRLKARALPGPGNKEPKTARELADLIAARIGSDGVFVAVHKDPVHGWHPTVITAPAAAYKCQVMAEQIADELRAKYELSE
ncbi:MAG TPA: hypothetical protein VGG45_18115 [Terracidiphilus sp.]|jgi:hypothetical protein